MLSFAYIVNFLGMILLPILAWIYFSHRFKLSWVLILAGGLTFIASQIPHIPLVAVFAPLFKSWGMTAYAITLGLMAGLFEETARFILFKFILQKSRSWKEGVLVGLGHGGTEAIIFGFLAAITFVNMLVYKNLDLSTVKSIPADQLNLAKQQVAAYWSIPVYVGLLGVVERFFAICLHISLSTMVLYSIASNKPLWFWGALVWHAFVDAVAVYLGLQGVHALALEGVVAILAIIGLVTAFLLRSQFPPQSGTPSEKE